MSDTGEPDPRLAAALAAHAGGPTPARRAEVLAALVDARVFLCLAARRSGSAVDMAMLSVVRADGARVVPVFADGHAVQRWRPEARPRPVDGPAACATALQDGAAGVVLDPGGAAVALTRDELVRLARGWVPVAGTALAARRTTAALTAPAAAAPDPALVDALGRALAEEPVRAARLLEGPDGPVLGLDADLEPAALAALARRVVHRLGAALPADGLDVAVVRGPGPGVVVPLPRRAGALRRRMRRSG